MKKLIALFLSGTMVLATTPLAFAAQVPAVAPTPQIAPIFISSLITAEGLVSVIPPNPLPAPDLKYTVQVGETFEDIAFYYYGSSKKALVNKIKDLNADYLYSTKGVLEAGAVITLPANPSAAPDLRYTVQKDETLEGIAFNYYGSTKKDAVAKIKDANADYLYSTKGVLEAGAVITLPAKGLLNPLTLSGLTNVAGMYLAQPKDTLGGIAKTYYGNANQWEKIYDANKDRLKSASKTTTITDKQWLIIPN